MPPNLLSFLSETHLSQLLQLAHEEDLGPKQADITSQLVIPANAQATINLTAREPGVLAGIATLPHLLRTFEAHIDAELLAKDTDTLTAGQPLARFTGNLRTLLTVERPLLNLLSHLSGIATHTAQLASRIAHTRATLCDTRKTIPAYRGLAKYAVVCGGGTSHRMGLYDAILIKDNHIAHIPDSQLTEHVTNWVRSARDLNPKPQFFEIEIDRLSQLEPVLKAGVDIALLDNMPPEQLAQAVDIRNKLAPQTLLEASGGITETTLVPIAEAGVDRISIGALTHTVRALDLGFDREPAHA